MFEKTDAEKRFENERRERYQFIIDLRTTNPSHELNVCVGDPQKLLPPM